MKQNIDDAMLDRGKSSEAYDIENKRPSPQGNDVPVSTAGRAKILASLERYPQNNDQDQTASVEASGQPQCFLPDLQGERVWGVALQLYELRSRRNWGIGDFDDLSTFIDLAAGWGADFVGLNPLHAPFMAAAERCSPYEPSNRRFLNPLYIAVDRIDGFASSPELEEDIARLQRTELVDYGNVARIKREVLYRIWTTEKRREDPAFQDFCREGGAELRLHALFEAISETLVASGGSIGWKAWPQEYQDPQSETVKLFAETHGDRVDFHLWLQYLAHGQLTEASARAKAAGMRVGLYLDVAVGEALDGSATWSSRHAYVEGASIGSPPDPMAVYGQDWQLAAFHPSAIASGNPSPFETTMEGVMRYAGAVRIDHAAALRRLFLVPSGESPEEGAYVGYPQQALIKTLADLSNTYGCLVIGEDLGNLPQGLQGELEAANILSYRILSYEQGKQGFHPPDQYPALALACVSTHDHQTFSGWWRAADVMMREKNDLVPEDAARQQKSERKSERRDVLSAFRAADLIGSEAVDHSSRRNLAATAHAFVARTPSLLMAVRLADLTDEKQPTNVPGTSDSYPNWKPKLSVMLEELDALPELHDILGEVAAARRK